MKIHNYDTELEELKNYPFCGGRPIAHLIGNQYKKKITIVIKCKKCRIERRDSTLRHSTEWLEEIAIRNWNQRPIQEKKEDNPTKGYIVQEDVINGNADEWINPNPEIKGFKFPKKEN